MKISVTIPSFARPTELNNCLEHIAKQTSLEEIEVLVGLDGDADLTPSPMIPSEIAEITTIRRFEKIGHIPIRRALLEQANGQVILSLNDDSYCAPDLVESHRAMHASQHDRVIAGKALWKRVQSPTMFDRFVQESDLLFFRQQECCDPVLTDYRNCYGLNMSFPKALAIEVGGFPNIQGCYGHEDIELAYRLAKAGAQLWYVPSAQVVHDHRYRAEDVLKREYLIGRSAWVYSGFHSEFMLDLLKVDIRDPDRLRYFAQVLSNERRDAIRIERSFLALEDAPPDEFEIENSAVCKILEEHWILLKRYLWRWGVLDAASGKDPRWSLLSQRAEDFFEHLDLGLISCL